MIFYSLTFLIFFLVFSVIIQISPNSRIQNFVFLAANIVFYGYWNYRFLLLLAAVVLLCYFSGIIYSKNSSKAVLNGAAVLCLAVLGVFKYFDFFSESFSKVFGITDYVTLNLVLPLGISFYLFQAMSYLFDIKMGKVEVEKDLIKLSAYISFFPQITSGPIVKSKDFLPQLDRLHRIRKENVYAGLELFLFGLTKKIVIADRIGEAVDAVYSAPAAYNGISVLFAIIGYSFQIYCDFSGYSSMAIGIAKIWDFDLGENFNIPYLAKNPSDFWRRWHISLSTWFRDYVYIPLGGNRKGKIRTYLNLFITMVLSGIWHGANGTFIVWGIVHGLGSALHKLFGDVQKSRGKKYNIPAVLSVIINFVFVSIAWVIFRADNMGMFFTIMKSLFNTSGLMYINAYVVIFIIMFVLANILIARKADWKMPEFYINLDKFSGKLLVAVWAWLVVMLMYCGNTAFIYAKF